MSFELKPHQFRCVQAYEDLRASGERFRRCITSATGTGKSIVMTTIAENEVARGGRVVLYSIRRLLTDQFIKQLQRDGIPFGCRAAEFDEHVDEDAPVQICSMQTELARVLRKRKKQGLEGDIARRMFPLAKSTLVILDEAHLVKADTAAEVVGEHVDLGADVLGFSATPFGCSHMFDSGGLIFGADVSEGRDCGLLVPCFVKSCPEMDTTQIEKVKTSNGDWSEADIRKYCWTQAIYGYVFESMVQFNPEMKPFFLFAPGVEESVGFEAHFRKQGIRVAHIDATDIVLDGKRYPSNRDVRRSVLKEHEEGSIKGICNRWVLREALDAPWVEFVSLATPFGSLTTYLQVCLDSETEVLTKRGWLGPDEILGSDIVAQMDIESGESSWSKCLGIVDRDSLGEEMVHYSTPYADVRVTKSHDMLVSTRTSRSWKKQDAGSVSNRKNLFFIPVSADENVEDIPVTDDEIRLAAWYCTDGTLNKSNRQLSIDQSESNHGYIHESIKAMLDGLNLSYKTYRTERTGEFAKYAANIRYGIGKRDGNSPGKIGWGHFSHLLDKGIPDCLLGMSRRQLLLFLEVANMADGAKPNNLAWKKKTLDISKGNRKFIDRLQAMCVMRGIRANVAVQTVGRMNPIYTLHATPGKTKHCVGGTTAKDRASFIVEPVSCSERVWCVSTEKGTIFTRRNGKVAILGNCGRVLRASPKTGKSFATLLDHGGSAWRFGSPNADRHPIFAEYFDDPDGARIAKEARLEAIRQEKEECPIACPKCGSVQLAMKTGLCYNCNHDLRGKSKRFVIQRDGQLIEVTGLPVKPRKQVRSPDMVDAWARAYWASKRKGGKLYGHTFAQLRGMIASGNFGGFEHLRGQWVANDAAMTPKDPSGWFRKTCDVQSMMLNQ